MSTPTKSTEQLIEGCQGLVRSLAWKIHRNLPSYVDIDDLIGYGQLGVAEAARDFDPTRGGRFTTFAYYRIRGAIYDGLSKLTWFSRAQYHAMRYEQMANELLRLEGEPDAEPAGSRVEDEARWLKGLTGSLAVVYLATHPDGDDENAEAMPIEDQSAPAPLSVAIGRETSQKLHELIDALPVEAGSLIRAVYFEGLTLQEAGQRLGVSKAWASRLHAKTLARLARSLQRLGVGD